MESHSERVRLAVPVGERDHVRGPASAEVTLVEYGDFECPYTRRARPVVRRLRQDFGDRLLFVFRNFPLARIHPHAETAAEAAEAAADQGHYWEMHDMLFDNQRALEVGYLRRYAERLGLDMARFGRELAEHTHAHRVNEDVRSGLKSGVRGTPTFSLTASGTTVPTTSRRCEPPWRKRRGERQFGNRFGAVGKQRPGRGRGDFPHR